MLLVFSKGKGRVMLYLSKPPTMFAQLPADTQLKARVIPAATRATSTNPKLNRKHNYEY
jgi:hypothetical protein